LIRATLYQCCTYPNVSTSARLDSRYRDSDRYMLIVPVRIIR